MRVLFSTVALAGHLFPLVPLAWAARSQGHEVLVATSENYLPMVTQAGLPAVSCGPPAGLEDLARAAALDLSREGSADALSRQRYAHGRAFAVIARRNLPGLLGVIDSWRPDVVVRERAEYAGRLACGLRGLPQVELHWGVSELREYDTAATEELSDLLGGQRPESLPQPAMVVNPWPPTTRPRYAAPHLGLRHVAYNGPTVLDDLLLDRPRLTRICVTLGTVLPHLGERTGILALLEELARPGTEIVVAVDDEVAAGWPPLPARVRFAGRVPLAQVLDGSTLLVNHAGQGTALTALAKGCPQLLLPHFDDQFDNADAVTKTGAGLSLLPEEVTPRAVARACATVLDDPVYARAARQVAREVAAQPSPHDVVARFTALVG